MVRLPDPLPTDGDPGRWWPPSVLDPEWLSAHASCLDVVHVHFGFEAVPLKQLRQWAQLLRRLRLPLVVTVHDLVNPHLQDDQQDAYRRRLAVLVERADALLTLTSYASDRLRRDFGRDATVLPHPQVVPGGRMAEPRRPVATAAPRTVGMFLGSARASVDPTPWVTGLATEVAREGGDFTVVARDDLADDSAAAARVRTVDEQLRGVGHRGVEPMSRPSDGALFAWVAQQDVVALPHRRGTHSGWLELCWDLGTSVLIPDVGALPHQHTDAGFGVVFDPALARGAAEAFVALRADRPAAGGWHDPAHRRGERDRLLRLVLEAHLDIYTGLVPDRGASLLPA